MPCAPVKDAPDAVQPHSEVAGYLIERQYQALGVDRWNRRSVMTLCAQLGDTPIMMAKRLRLRPSDFERRMESDCFTKQDGLILSLIQREMDFLKGGIPPKCTIV